MRGLGGREGPCPQSCLLPLPLSSHRCPIPWLPTESPARAAPLWAPCEAQALARTKEERWGARDCLHGIFLAAGKGPTHCPRQPPSSAGPSKFVPPGWAPALWVPDPQTAPSWLVPTSPLLQPIAASPCQMDATAHPPPGTSRTKTQPQVPFPRLLCRGWHNSPAPRHVSINSACEGKGRHCLLLLLTGRWSSQHPHRSHPRGRAGGALQLGGSS